MKKNRTYFWCMSMSNLRSVTWLASIQEVLFLCISVLLMCSCVLHFFSSFTSFSVFICFHFSPFTSFSAGILVCPKHDFTIYFDVQQWATTVVRPTVWVSATNVCVCVCAYMYVWPMLWFNIAFFDLIRDDNRKLLRIRIRFFFVGDAVCMAMTSGSNGHRKYFVLFADHLGAFAN